MFLPICLYNLPLSNHSLNISSPKGFYFGYLIFFLLHSLDNIFSTSLPILDTSYMPMAPKATSLVQTLLKFIAPLPNCLLDISTWISLWHISLKCQSRTNQVSLKSARFWTGVYYLSKWHHHSPSAQTRNLRKLPLNLPSSLFATFQLPFIFLPLPKCFLNPFTSLHSLLSAFPGFSFLPELYSTASYLVFYVPTLTLSDLQIFKTDHGTVA